MAALRAVQDEVGCRVCLLGLQSRPELDRLAGTVISVNEARGRIGVQLDDGQRISLPRRTLMREEKSPWEKCRHGGPEPDPELMEAFNALFEVAMQLTAPCLEHVRLLEKHVRRYAVPPILVASMGVDAYIARDYNICRSFAVCAIVLQGVREEGLGRFFKSVKARLRGKVGSPTVVKVETQLAKCTRASGLFEVLDSFVECPLAAGLEAQAVAAFPGNSVAGFGREWSCLHVAAHRGVGLKQSHIDPAPSPMDAIFEGREPSPQTSGNAAAAQAGEKIARLALQCLATHGSTIGSRRDQAIAMRDLSDMMLASIGGVNISVSRAEKREDMMKTLELLEVGGAIFVDGGGAPLLNTLLARCLTDSVQGDLWLQQDTLLGDEARDEVLFAFEVVERLQSTAVAFALIRGGGAKHLCNFMSSAHDFVVDIRATSALSSILAAADTSEIETELGARLDSVVRFVAQMMQELLRRDELDFSHLEQLLQISTTIAGVSAELACLVATAEVRGMRFSIPSSLLLILCRHAQAQQAGQLHGTGPNGLNIMVHVQPISKALVALYTISLHFDLRVVTLFNGVKFVDALEQYVSFLHGFVHFQNTSPMLQACLARLRQFTHLRAPPMNPGLAPIETELGQVRRLRLFARSMHEARGRVLEQRREQRAHGVGPTIERANNARLHGNELIMSRRFQEAADAYSEAVVTLTGLESDVDVAWSLVLALSNRAEALRRLDRHEAVLDDCTSAWMLLERYEGLFDVDRADAIGEKLVQREASTRLAAEAQQRGGVARQASAAQDQARTERRRRAQEAFATQRGAELARANAVGGTSIGAAVVAEADNLECPICLEGSKYGPLEDVCGYGHFIHLSCAAVWRETRLEQQRIATWRGSAENLGPSCPTCRRRI